MPTKLDETNNLVALYMHHAGHSMVPKVFHLWCCLSVISSMVADRVGVKKFKHKLLSPNLYVLLIAQSSAGKGNAIDVACKYIENTPEVTSIIGKLSGMGLVDYLAEQTQLAKAKARSAHDMSAPIDRTKLTLVMGELGLSIGTGATADQFIKTMTELYSAGGSSFYERTRMGGAHEITRPCINWLAGSTLDWLMGSVTPDHILSGFFGRTCTIVGKKPKGRILTPTYPDDYDEVNAHLALRFSRLTRLTGEFTKTEQACKIEEEWFYQRPETDDPAMEPFEGREHDLMLKLAMLLSLADREDLVIESSHVRRAQELVGTLRATLPNLIDFAFSTGDTKPTAIVGNMIQRAGEITRTGLVRSASKRGISPVRLAEAVKSLYEQRLIKILPGKQGFRWIRRDAFSQILRDVGDDDEATDQQQDQDQTPPEGSPSGP